MNRGGELTQRFHVSYRPTPSAAELGRAPMRAVTVRVEIEALQGIDEPVIDLAARLDATVAAWEREVNAP